MGENNYEGNRRIEEYTIGDYDRRPWGFWLVTDVPVSGDANYCEKIIVVSPKQILSLQSHNLRHETWTVLDGTLVAIINDKCSTLVRGQAIEVPLGAPHSMANLSDAPCIIKERQAGICRESDITRYLDAYGRITGGTNERINKTVNLYLAVLEKMQEREQQYA